MKKFIYSVAALTAMIFAGSCQQENLEPVAQESTVTFSVELPGVQTKTIGDGFNVDQLVYEVWKTESKEERDLKDVKKATRLYQQKATMANIDGEQKTVISLNLVHDQNYTILFWAQNSKGIGNEPAYNTTDLTAVTYAKKLRDDNFNNGEYLSNNENMAAFYGVAFLEAADVEVPSTRRVELKRPFAQLNIGTKNTPTEYKVKMNKSRVKIANVPSVFDVAQNIAADSKKGTPAQPAVSDTLAFVYEYADLPTDPSTLTVNNIPYEYVAMNYIFADGNVEVQYWIDATLTATNPTNGRNETTNAVVYNRVPQVPLKENYRTNIVGNLLSSTTQYEVVIDASWDDVNAENWDGNVEEVWDENYIQEPYFNAEKNQYEISLASELAWLAASVNGMPYIDPATNSVAYKDPVTFEGIKFVVVEDIDLVGEDGDHLIWTPIGATGKFMGTFDGQGHTISNLVVKAEGKAAAGLFANAKYVKNLTVDGAQITGQYKTGVIVGDGLCTRIENCHVKNATVTVTPYNNDDANHVGGIVGYLSGENEAYVKNSSVKNATITGYRDVAAIAGTANQKAEVTGNSVENVTVVSNQIAPYVKNDYDGNAGVFAGRIHAKANVSDNTEGANVVVKRYVDSTEELEYAVADAQSGDTIYIGGEVTMPYFTDKTLNFEGVNANAVVKQSPATHNDEYYAGAELNFKNLTLVGTSYKNDTQGYQKSVKETYTECHFVNYIMFAGDVTEVNYCTFENEGQYFWTGTADNITFNNCTFDGTERAVKVCTVGNAGERTVTFNNCEFKAENGTKSAIEIDGTKGSSYIVNINNSTDDGFAVSEITGETLFNIEGMENVKVYINGVLWKLRNPHYEVVEEEVDGETIKTYQVYTAEGLAKFSYMQNNVERDINLEIMNDIEFPQFQIAADDVNETYYFTDTPITVTNGVPSGSNWVAIGDYSKGDTQNNLWFYSKIEGNGNTISGLRMTSTTAITGFVGYIDTTTGSITNLNLNDAVISNTAQYTGAIAAWMGDGVVVRNCHLTDIHISGDDKTGGVVGYSVTRYYNDIGTCIIENCSIDDKSTVSGDTEVGGIVGRNYGSIVKNSINQATVLGNNRVGGITGYALDNGSPRDSRVIACKNTGKITGNKNIGGIVGESAKSSTAESLMVACYTTANVADYANLLIGTCSDETKNYSSWGLKTNSDQKPLTGGESTACYAFDSAANITQDEVAAMNAAIDTYNTDREATDADYCPYKWVWTAGSLPVLQ